MAATREQLEELVLAYLSMIGDRELGRAAERLSADVVMVFPGDEEHVSLHDQQAAAVDRYRDVRKSFGSVDVDLERQVVVVQGTLTGENVHGVAFQHVRFVDRFEIVDGLICRQEVWNDLGVTGVLNAQRPADMPQRYRQL